MKFKPPGGTPTISATLAAAREAEARGRLSDAEALCRKVLAQQPHNVEAMLLRSSIAARSGSLLLAQELLRTVLSNRPDCVEALITLARLLRKVRGQEEAMELCRHAITLEPGNAEAHLVLGLSLIDSWRVAEAIDALQKAVELRPTLGAAYDRLGRALELEGRDAESTEAYRTSVKLAPNIPNGFVNLGQHLARLGAIDEAETAFGAAERAASGSAAHLCELGGALAKVGNTERAEAALRRAIELSPTAGPARLLLSQVLIQTGRFDEALQLLKDALAFHPNDASLYYELVYAKRITDRDWPMIESITQLLGRTTDNTKDRANLHYALGKAYDDLGDFDQAMGHFQEANRSAKINVHWVDRDREAHTKLIDAVIATFTPEFLAEHTGLGSESEEPVFIVGMPRSGTTLIEQILSSHPAVGASGELSYLSALGLPLVKNGKSLDPGLVRELAEGYLRRIRLTGCGRPRITDKLPHNFILAGLIHVLFPKARIIHCRRNPLDTCLSIYVTPIAIDFSHSLGDIAFSYREYQRLMEHWRKILPPDRFIELDYEELATNPMPVERRLLDFLALKWDDAVLTHGENDRAIKTASRWQARQPIHAGSVGRWRNYQPWIADLLKEFPEGVPISARALLL